MSMAFDYAEDWIPLTSVQMARSRRANFRQNGNSGTFRDLPMDAGKYYYPYRRRPKWRRIFIVMTILLVLALLFGYLFYLGLQAYTPFTNNIEVAQLTVQQSREGKHQLSIRLTHFDANNHPITDRSPYIIDGDTLQLKYKYIVLPSLLGILGLHSGYLLTDLEGYYSDGTHGTTLRLNNADEDNSLPAQLITLLATSSNITLMPSRSIHKVYISQTGQLYEPTNQG